MGFSHGVKWSEDLIEQQLNQIVLKFNLKNFPSLSQIKTIRGKWDLSNAIAKRGGCKYWADKLNMPVQKCETYFGKEYEEKCFNKLYEMGYEVEQMSTKHPYDLTANKHIKIDVKVGKLYAPNGSSGFYTFNLEKKNPTCDIFVCYCVNEEYEIEKIYVIPSNIMHGKTQLSIGRNMSVYDKYKDDWNILRIYDDFYKQVSK